MRSRKCTRGISPALDPFFRFWAAGCCTRHYLGTSGQPELASAVDECLSKSVPYLRGEPYFAFDVPVTCGFEKSDSSSLGFTITFSMTIFSVGTVNSLIPFAAGAAGRTFVSIR